MPSSVSTRSGRPCRIRISSNVITALFFDIECLASGVAPLGNRHSAVEIAMGVGGLSRPMRDQSKSCSGKEAVVQLHTAGRFCLSAVCLSAQSRRLESYNLTAKD